MLFIGIKFMETITDTMLTVCRKFLKHWEDTFDYWRVSRRKYLSRKLPEIESPRSNVTSPSITLTDTQALEKIHLYHKNNLKCPGLEGGKHEGPHPLGGEHAGADSLYRYNLSPSRENI